MSTPFRFKQFEIRQDNCAMKIGTDGVLLGAWVNLEQQPYSILDIGAGTGIIGLMLAQRSGAELIDALELDKNAFQQCVDNFENSPWGDRLFCYHASFDEFVEEMDDTYDLIVSNPPFFKTPQNNTLSEPRQKARFTKHLSFENLVKGASQLLSKQGEFAVVIPYSAKDEFTELASAERLFLARITFVKGHPSSSIKRCLLQFGRKKISQKKNELIIETKRHHYTPDYKALTKAFYLNI